MKELFSVDFKGLFRGLLFSIIGTALILCLLFLAYSLIFNFVTSKPEKVKSILEKSSLYTDLPAMIYDQASKEAGDIPLENPEIRQIALDVYSPEFAKSSVENSIDGFYSWLSGESDKPEIVIDFSKKNIELRNKLSKYARKKAAKLPPCTFNQLQKIRQYDAFDAKCLPPSVNPAVVEADVRKQLSSKDSLFQNAKITADDIKTNNGEPFYQSLGNLPQTFAVAKSIPAALTIFAVILVIIIFYVSENRVSALRRVSRLVLTSGILIAIIPFIFLSGGKALLNKTSDDEPAGNIVRSIFEQFMLEASKIYYIIGILLILTAIGLYVYSRKLQNDTDKIPKTKR